MAKNVDTLCEKQNWNSKHVYIHSVWVLIFFTSLSRMFVAVYAWKTLQTYLICCKISLCDAKKKLHISCTISLTLRIHMILWICFSKSVIFPFFFSCSFYLVSFSSRSHGPSLSAYGHVDRTLNVCVLVYAILVKFSVPPVWIPLNNREICQRAANRQ